jgi:hypothetical protein
MFLQTKVQIKAVFETSRNAAVPGQWNVSRRPEAPAPGCQRRMRTQWMPNTSRWGACAHG